MEITSVMVFMDRWVAVEGVRVVGPRGSLPHRWCMIGWYSSTSDYDRTSSLRTVATTANAIHGSDLRCISTKTIKNSPFLVPSPHDAYGTLLLSPPFKDILYLRFNTHNHYLERAGQMFNSTATLVCLKLTVHNLGEKEGQRQNEV